jgi:hypothetical protein
MRKLLIIVFILCMATPAMGGWRYKFRPRLRYNMCPQIKYEVEPVKKTKSVLKQVTRKIVGYRKVCGPNGCRLDPIYENTRQAKRS